MNRSRTTGAAVIIIALTLLAYSRAMTAGWIWDDPQYVVNNQTLRDLSGLFDIWFKPTSIPQWYPLVHTTFWIEYQWWGVSSAAGYHVTNILLHTANALLLWRLLARLRVPGAWLAAAVFALHPVMVESVAWVTERKNVLSMLFYLLALRVYLFNVERIDTGVSFVKPTAPPWAMTRAYLTALALFLCALLSKSVTASLPAAILVILWWKRGEIRKRDVGPLIPFFIAGIVMAAVTSWLEVNHVGADGSKIAELDLTWMQRIFIAGRAVWFYAGKLFWPTNLTFIYPRWESVERSAPWLVIFPLAVVAFVAGLWSLRNHIGRAPLAAALLYCGTLLPALGFVNVYPLRFSFVADHFQYHASAALIALVVAIGAHLFASHRGTMIAISVVLLLRLLTLTHSQTRIYDNALTLWTDTLAKNPRSWMVHTNLANELVALDRPDDAERHYLEALALAPNLHDTHANAGNVFGRRGDYSRAIDEFQQSLAINPQFAPAYYGWAQVLHKQDQTDQALLKLDDALRIAPHYPEANFLVGVIREQRGDLPAAAERYRIAVTYNPSYVAARYNLGVALLRLKQFDEAVANFHEAAKLKPDYVEAWTNLGNGLLLTGNANDAIAAFDRALSLRPGFAPAMAGRAQAQSLRGR